MQRRGKTKTKEIYFPLPQEDIELESCVETKWNFSLAILEKISVFFCSKLSN